MISLRTTPEPAHAAPQDGGSPPASRPEVSKAARADAKPATLYGLRWYPSLEQALEKATSQSRKNRPKPVLWLRMLGDLAGET